MLNIYKTVHFLLSLCQYGCQKSSFNFKDFHNDFAFSNSKYRKQTERCMGSNRIFRRNFKCQNIYFSYLWVALFLQKIKYYSYIFFVTDDQIYRISDLNQFL